MATSENYISYVCEQLKLCGEIKAKKMFGEYMIYLKEKPVAIVCDNTFYVKKLKEIEDLCKNLEVGCPYNGAKEHYILDIDDGELVRMIIGRLFDVLPMPKARKKNSKS